MYKKIVRAFVPCALSISVMAAGEMESHFLNPPDSARPGVYWYFLNGNLNGKEMTADLESMKAAGLGNLIFLEVDLGVPPVGPVAFMSPKRQEIFVQTVRAAERLGIDITLGIGPGWCGSGGPWVKPEQAMQHLDFSAVDLTGPQSYSAVLPVPTQRSTEFHTLASPFYEDVAVLAFPSRKPLIADIDEKALFFRDPFSSKPGVKPYLPTSASYTELGPAGVIQPDQIVDLTKQLKPDGSLAWNVPAGDWTIVRMGRRVTGASTRPAPSTAIGLESDKFDAKALEEHLSHFVGVLLDKMSPRANEHGLTTLHMDSWESGAQNWTSSFLDEFKKRRGYDARSWLLAYTGRAVESLEKSERFLWDLRLTAQDLVLENHADVVKKYAHKNGLSLSIEPYDMNPAGDLDLGAVADVPMAEFWNNTFNTAFSVFELSSVGHVMGKSIVSAESFTSDGAMDAYPGSLKNQGDWAFCVGINRFVFHTFAHQALGDAYKPGMSFGPIGVHWHRNQTWWPMVSAYHRYITRCSELLRQGVTVSDVLYLTPEGAPQVFLPPVSAVDGAGSNMPDKKGYGFDGCSPKILMARAEVKDGMITFPGGSSYRLMVLPQVATMTPGLLAKIRDLVKAGATVVGSPPVKSPSLSGYPSCDAEVQALAKDLWGSMDAPKTAAKRSYGKGVIHCGGELSLKAPSLYPSYDLTAAVLKEMGVMEDFTATGPLRYGHRRTEDRDIYFVSNKTGAPIKADCRFRVGRGSVQLWDPVTGEQRPLPQFALVGGLTSIPMEFDAFQSFFVVFDGKGEAPASKTEQNFPELKPLQELSGAWEVAFDPKWGGPENFSFDTLQDWTSRPESGVKYYSGIATYRKTINLAQTPLGNTYLDLGVVHDMARVKLNGKDLGVVWCAPWRIEVTGAIKTGDNPLEIEVVNRWANRLVGDKQPADANVRTVACPPVFFGGQQFQTGRYTNSLHDPYHAQSPLISSGLLGPVILHSGPAF
ncbi:MAG: glycosyl hydrolase, partial [Verrucomicrobiota bacterium]